MDAKCIHISSHVHVCLQALNEGPEVAKLVLLDGLPMTVKTLQRSLETYKLRPSEGAIQLDTLPIVEEPDAPSQTAAEVPSSGGGDASTAVSQDGIAATLYKIPEMADLGTLFRSSRPVQLTESETEYVVSVVKHIFPQHLVLQFNVTNTLNDQLLQNVTVGCEISEPDVWEEESLVPLSKLPYGSTPGVTYVI